MSFKRASLLPKSNFHHIFFSFFDIEKYIAWDTVTIAPASPSYTFNVEVYMSGIAVVLTLQCEHHG